MSHVDEGTLHAYLDGELPSAERTTLEAHLAGCGTCRANLAEERALRERATAVLESARPAERPAPPLERLRREPKRSPWRVRSSFAWAASIALALGVGYYMRSTVSRDRAPQSPAQPVVVAENRTASTQEAKPAAPAAGPRRLGDRRAARPADEVARLAPRPDSAAAAQVVDSVRIDAKAVAGAVARAESDRPAAAPAANRIAQHDSIRQLTPTTWPVINRRAAKSILGEEPVGLPGLVTRAFRRAPGTDGTVVVEQALDSSTVIQIFQRSAGGAYLDDSSSHLIANEGRARLRGYTSEDGARERGNRLFARFVRGLRVEITGPLSADSLNRLLEQVAPLP